MRALAYAAGRSMTWERTAERYLTTFEHARHGHRLRVVARARPRYCVARHSTCSRNADRLSLVDVRRHRAVPACGPFRARSRSRLLRRRQCQSVVAGLCAQRSGRAAPARGLDGPVRVFRAGRLEPGYRAVSQLHELRSTLAGRSRFGGQPRADTLGLGRMRAQRCERVPSALGHRFVRRSIAGGGELHIAARMGLHAARAGRLLRRDRCGFRRQADAAAPRHPAGVHPVGRRDEGLGVVRGRAFLRQRAPVPGPDRHRTCDRDADLCRRRACDPCIG